MWTSGGEGPAILSRYKSARGSANSKELQDWSTTDLQNALDKMPFKEKHVSKISDAVQECAMDGEFVSNLKSAKELKQKGLKLGLAIDFWKGIRYLQALPIDDRLHEVRRGIKWGEKEGDAVCFVEEFSSAQGVLD